MTALNLKLARRYLLGRKGRSLITLLGIALGVTMVVAVLLTNQSIIRSYEHLLASAAGRADLQVAATTGAGFDAGLLGKAKATPGVAAAAPVVTTLAPVAAGQRQGGATIYGIDPAADRQIRDYKLLEGRLPDGAGRNEAAISQDLAAGLGLTTGDSFQLLTTKGMQAYRVVGRFDTSGTVRGALGPLAVLDLQAARAAFGKDGKLDLIDVKAAPGTDTAKLKAGLTSALGDSVTVGPAAERSKEMESVLDSINFVLTMAGSISLFAGAFIIYTNVAMGVAERRRDLASLRALGMKRGEVVRQVVGEAGLLGLLGSGLGLLCGSGLASFMAQQMASQVFAVYGLERAAVAVNATAVAVAFLMGTGTALVAAFGPARETVALEPVEAMRSENGHKEGPATHPGLRLAGGLAMIVAGAAFVWFTWPERGMLPPLMLRAWGIMLVLMLLGLVTILPVLLVWSTRFLFRPLLTALFGVTGRLAAENLVRQPRRTVATIASLLVTLTFMVGMGGVKASQIGTFNHWFAKVVGWDINVSTSFTALGANVEMDPAFERELAGVEGVRLVSPQKMIRVTLADGKPAFLQAFDHRLLRQYSQTMLEAGDWQQVTDAMEQGGGILISPPIARRLNLGVGDTLTLQTPTGPLPLTVRGLMKDVSSYGGTVQIERQDYVRAWNDRTSTNLAVLAAPGQDPAVVRDRILACFGDQMHLKVRLNREYWQEVMDVYNGFYRMMDGLTWIAIMVSGLAIANTLFASLLERKREVGVMRAVGTRRSEVLRMVAGEALGMGIVGGALGVMTGLGLMWVMTASMEFINGNSAELIIGWGAVGMALVVALLLAPLVSLLPARYAARLEIVDALRYE
jgi:putative ABC transport system permease protein